MGTLVEKADTFEQLEMFEEVAGYLVGEEVYGVMGAYLGKVVGKNCCGMRDGVECYWCGTGSVPVDFGAQVFHYDPSVLRYSYERSRAAGDV